MQTLRIPLLRYGCQDDGRIGFEKIDEKARGLPLTFYKLKTRQQLKLEAAKDLKAQIAEEAS